MNKRIILQLLSKKINEGAEGVSVKQIQDLFLDECASLYDSMMKSLNIVKTLRIEINNFN